MDGSFGKGNIFTNGGKTIKLGRKVFFLFFGPPSFIMLSVYCLFISLLIDLI